VKSEKVSSDLQNKIYSKFLRMLKKGKAIPLQPWTGPGGSRRLRRPDFKTIGT
jgi:antirestriction protein ArdC